MEVAKSLDPKLGFLQVTHVEPYFEDLDQLCYEEALNVTDFDMHHNVNKFLFEVPFTRPQDGSGDKQQRHATQLNEQCIRKTVLKS